MKWGNVALFAVAVSCLAVAAVTFTFAYCASPPGVEPTPNLLVR